MDPLTKYYIRQAGGGGGVGPVCAIPPFVQRGHWIGDFLSGLFRRVIPILFSGLRNFGKETPKALGQEALRTGGRILSDIADNPQVGAHEVISKHVQDSLQNLSTKMSGRGRKRKRRSTSRIRRKSERAKRTVSRLRKTKRKPKRKASTTRRVIL